MTAEGCMLVIDDSKLIRQIVKLVLSQNGWRVLTAETGGDGLALAISERPDAILLDVIMPDPDGPETLTRLRSDTRTAGIPVIFLSGLASTASEEARLSELGANGVLAKPFEPTNFAALVAGVLQRTP